MAEVLVPSIVSWNSQIENERKIESTVFIYYCPKPTINICLKFEKEDLLLITLQELIWKSIKKLKQEYLLEVTLVKSAYSIFPASRNGSKKEGYPELDKKIKLSQIRMKRFYLEEINKCFSLISTEFNLQRKYGIQKLANNNQQFCCSIFKRPKI